ncbi:MAG: signal peptidase II [Calditrichaceae bacterium]|nr:signal peptidase II [Calditrichaceae bacterium]
MKSALSIKMTPFIIGCMVILDQVSKYIVKTQMNLFDSKPVLGSFFQITYIENDGAAFGVQLGSPKIFLTLSVIAAILVFYYLIRMRDKNWLPQAALALIAAGAIGNLTDRFLYGKVVDFFDVEFFDISIPSFNLFGWTLSAYSMTRWPVFNVADIAITCGMIIMVSYLVFVGDPLASFQKQPAVLSNGSDGNN